MAYYHCSPRAGLTVLEPRKPECFEKTRGVYMTTSLPMALMYGVRNFEYSYGYTRDGQIYYEEYFPDALRYLYRGKSASLYLCAPGSVRATKIPNEVVADARVTVIGETAIPDVYEALLEQEKTGALVIRRYDGLSDEMREWIRKTEADIIREKGLLRADGPMAQYFRCHYPESWALAEEKDK
ncbi:MAG: hypothetical protein Q4D50_11830 [Eubacteriales bacterium]|nr:hypothetical protein [Eubacteriales bacterium]